MKEDLIPETILIVRGKAPGDAWTAMESPCFVVTAARSNIRPIHSTGWNIGMGSSLRMLHCIKLVSSSSLVIMGAFAPQPLR
jgi:hypothetical protein